MQDYGSVVYPLPPPRKTSSILSIIQTGDEPNHHIISLPALIFNAALLYGIGIAAELVPRWVGSVKRGFFCDDETIMYPYREDTFTPTFLFTYCILLVIVVIFLVELYRIKRDPPSTENPRYRFKNSYVNLYFVRTFTYFAFSQIGFVACLVVTNTTKSVAGRLRPHFLDVCQPIGMNCTGNPMQFVQNYTCMGDPEKVEEARKSFFSGHSTFSMFATIWCILYIQARIGRLGGNKVIIPMVQTVLMAMGLAICYSRVSDYKHHWSDVIVGIFAGSLLATYTCVCWAGLFSDLVKNNPILPTNSPFMYMEGERRNSSSPIEHINSPELENVLVEPRSTSQK